MESGYSDDSAAMLLALKEAETAAKAGEIPVGAVVVLDGKVVASAHNLCETDRDATEHAEMLALRAACRKLGKKRLTGCTLYVTLEPCPMCAGACVASRVSRVVYAAKDPRAGAFGSVTDLNRYPLESSPRVDSGILEDESLALMKRFFSGLRNS